HSARRMNDLVGELLNFARLTRIELKQHHVDLTGIARALAFELTARDPHREVEFAIEDGVSGWGDSTLLRATMLNLMENSWKFTRKHASTRIEFGVTQTPDGPAYFLRD